MLISTTNIQSWNSSQYCLVIGTIKDEKKCTNSNCFVNLQLGALIEHQEKQDCFHVQNKFCSLDFLIPRPQTFYYKKAFHMEQLQNKETQKPKQMHKST